MPRERRVDRGIPDHQKSLYALGTAFATYGVAVGLPLEGNGLIAVFVCAIALGIRRPDLRATFERRAEDIVEIVKLGVFVVFGSLLTLDGLFGDGWAAVAIVAVTLLVARPVAIVVALAGTGLPAALKAFMAWFGPKGVATMTFSLLVLGSGFPGDARIFNLAALCVFVSILAHGLTDTPGIRVDRSGVKRGLLLRRRERPRGLAPALLAEHEAQLARRAQPLRMVGPERRARLVECERAQPVAPEEAILAGHLPRLHVPCRHFPRPLLIALRHRTRASKARRSTGVQRRNPQTARFSRLSPQIPANGPKTSLSAGTALRNLGGFRAPVRRGRCADAHPRHRRLRLRRRGARPGARRATATRCAASPARPSGSRRPA